MLDSLADNILFDQLKSLVRSERKMTAQILDYILEVNRRKLFLDLGYSSLFDFLTRGLGYNEASAYRRMQAARLLGQVPQVKESLEKGEVNLTTLAKVQGQIRQEEKRTGERLAMEDRIELLDAVKNLKTDQVEVTLPSEPAEVDAKRISAEGFSRGDQIKFCFN